MASRIDEAPITEPLWGREAWPKPEYTVNRSRRHRILSRVLGLPTEEEVEARMLAEREAERNLPETVPPDDPWRMEMEARMRAVGIRPAVIWNWPEREPIRIPDWRDWLRTRLGG
ncbi:MAG TPA: hypothetical protein VF665_05610 [Longimicrobium sp.]|jgi:hypothetical protein|uniref:hypothetical protein n=1 Tax=Longimicrobium sp. TaxID=2029185 RepID=UPI002ED9D0F5